MNAKIPIGICILLLACGISSAQVNVNPYISRIEYEVTPSKYVNKGETVTIQVQVMGKHKDATTWDQVSGTVEVSSDPVNSAIPVGKTVPGGGTVSFIPDKDTWVTLKFNGHAPYPASEKKILIGVLYFSSPLVSSQFIMLLIILILALLSYRFFGRGKLDINSLFREIRGE